MRFLILSVLISLFVLPVAYSTSAEAGIKDRVERRHDRRVDRREDRRDRRKDRREDRQERRKDRREDRQERRAN